MAAKIWVRAESSTPKWMKSCLLENKRNEEPVPTPMLGNVGTLLVPLGNHCRKIGTFGSVASVNPVEKAALLTQQLDGNEHNCLRTDYGQSLVMFAILQNRANRIAEDLNQGSLKIFNWLSFNYEDDDRQSQRASRGL